MKQNKILESWFSCLSNDLGIDLFSYNYSFNDYLRNSYSGKDIKTIEEKMDSLSKTKFNFLVDDKQEHLSLDEFVVKYESLVRNREEAIQGKGNHHQNSSWEYKVNLTKKNLPDNPHLSVNCDVGNRDILVLLTSYVDNKYCCDRLKDILDTKLKDDEIGIVQDYFFGKLKKNDFSFFPKGSIKEEFVSNFNKSMGFIHLTALSEMLSAKEIYAIKNYNSIRADNKLEYKNAILDIIKQHIKYYGPRISNPILDEIKKFYSHEKETARKHLVSKDINAVFWNNNGKDNVPLISLSSRIKQKERIIQKLAWKSALYFDILKDHKRGDDSFLRIDDMVISDILGIMKVYKPNQDFNMLAGQYYKRPCWITIEDKPHTEKLGHQRQTKLIHSNTGVILDLHERDPLGLFSCHFGSTSQEVFERKREHQLSPKSQEIYKKFVQKLSEFFDDSFEFKRLY